MGESPRLDRTDRTDRPGPVERRQPREQLGLPMSGGYESSDLDPSDRLMGILEERVVSLMERFDDARKRISALEDELADRDAQLEAVVGQQEALKAQLRDRLTHVIQRITELEKLEAGKDRGN